MSLVVRPFVEADRAAVIALWHACGLTRPWNDPDRDIDRKLAVADDLLLVGELDAVVVATAMAGYDGHRGWVNYLGVHPDHRGSGFARTMMAAVEHRVLVLGAAKLNLQIRRDNAAAIGFYEAIGYAEDDVRSFGRRLIADD